MKEIILLAQKQLISPDKFYQICQKYRHLNKINRLYFLEDNLKVVLNKSIKISYYLIFFDYLAKIIHTYPSEYKSKFYLRKILLWNYGKIIKVLQVKKSGKFKNCDHISLKIVGEGMIGRVAKLKFNGNNWAFKSFFYPEFVWLHGPWGEIPVGIYLKNNKVTKNFAEFELGGENWAIWEWIDSHSNPSLRTGITYEQFAEENGLTKLNYLNGNNYNSYQIRLDAGGVQKEYYGRRLIDCMYGIIFYLMKAKNEGISSLFKYLNKDNFVYVIKRIQAIINNYEHRRNY